MGLSCHAVAIVVHRVYIWVRLDDFPPPGAYTELAGTMKALQHGGRFLLSTYLISWHLMTKVVGAFSNRILPSRFCMQMRCYSSVFFDEARVSRTLLTNNSRGGIPPPRPGTRLFIGNIWLWGRALFSLLGQQKLNCFIRACIYIWCMHI